MAEQRIELREQPQSFEGFFVTGLEQQDIWRVADLVKRLGGSTLGLVSMSDDRFQASSLPSPSESESSLLAYAQTTTVNKHTELPMESAYERPPNKITASREDFLSWYEARESHGVRDYRQRAIRGAAFKRWNWLTVAMRDGFPIKDPNPPALPRFQNEIYLVGRASKQNGEVTASVPQNAVLDIEHSTDLDIVALAKYIIDVAGRLEHLNQNWSIYAKVGKEIASGFLPKQMTVKSLIKFTEFCNYCYVSPQFGKPEVDIENQKHFDRLFKNDLKAAREKLKKLDQSRRITRTFPEPKRRLRSV